MTMVAIVLGAVTGARAQNVITTVAVGNSPTAIAADPATDQVYVANLGSANVTVINGATNATTTVAAGTRPTAIAVNPVTNQIYVANSTSNNVTVIDGATNATTTVAAGAYPYAIAVNPVTNRIYVANNGSNNVTVIDGATNATTTVAAGTNPSGVAVNPVTNQVYIANSGSDNVTVIDGATNATTTVAAGTGPYAISVNPVTNQIYVANEHSANVTVINGATNVTTTVAAGNNPFAVAVDPVTNKIYVANSNSANVTVIDGATNATTTVAAGTEPYAISVNSVTNQIYVANNGSSDVTVINGATNTTATVAVTAPVAIVVNPVTDKVYVANGGGANVTVIDGATNAAATVTVGTTPYAVAVNSVTNKIYVGNQSTNNVTVIDGATNATASVTVGPTSHEIVVNPVTNKIYEIDDSANVTVIDGASNTTTSIALAGADPNGIAVNPVTNRIYVTHYDGSASGNFVAVIDGTTNAIIATVKPGNGPVQGGLGVNPVTNRIYVSNYNDNTVAVIDGVTNSVIATVPVGSNPEGLVLNPVTNTVYVTNFNSNFVTVINGATNAATNVTIPSTSGTLGYGFFLIAVNTVTKKIYISGLDGVAMVIDGATNVVTPLALAGFPGNITVNPVTNRVYFPSNASNNTGIVTVLDGATDNIIANVAAGSEPIAVAVNPVTNQVYAANYGISYVGTTVTAITEAQVQTVPLSVSITPLTGNQTSNATPTFRFAAQSSFKPTAPPPQEVLFQVDTCQGAWTRATGSGSSFTGRTAPLLPGFHFLYAYADDGQDATSVQADSPLTGAIAAYGFLVTPQAAGSPNVTTQPASQTVNSGQSVAFSIAATGTPTPAYQWFFNGTPIADGDGISGSSTSTLYLSGASAGAGTYTCTATNSVGSVSTNGATLTVVNTSTPGRLIDISSRALVGTGANVLIAGYVIQGSDPLPVLVRSSGPALVPLGVTGVLPDPQLQLYSGSTVVGSNAGWGGNSKIASTANAVGAFAWTSPGSKDSALLETQNPGAYTAITSGVSGDSGVALAEVYDATPSGTWNLSLSRLGDISARAYVGTGGNVLIAGFVIGGSTAKTVLIRASGPALAPLGVTGVLPDPQLQLYSDSTVIYSNAGWGGNAAVAAAASNVGAFTWSNPSSNDSAILVTLSPGAYTAIVSGVSGDTGVSLVEVYDVP